MSFTLDTSHFEISLLNDFAPVNMPCMVVTRDTSHFEMSALNDVAPANMWLMSVTRDTSQFPIGLNIPKPSAEYSRYASIASLSSALVFGENTVGTAVAAQAAARHSHGISSKNNHCTSGSGKHRLNSTISIAHTSRNKKQLQQ